MNVTASQDGISILQMVSDASLLVKFVMLMLLLASLISWTMIFRKWFALRSLTQTADTFEEAFWSGGDLERLFQQWSSSRSNAQGVCNIFVAGYSEYGRLSTQDGLDRAELVDGVHRAMRVALSREVDVLETHLSFLATVGSTSPYVGLFGTVWGIMNSFRSLGVMKQASISTVAPGIAEALIATAMGLFAAIPAVIAYNRFSNSAEHLSNRYEIFMEEFLAIVNRQTLRTRQAAKGLN